MKNLLKLLFLTLLVSCTYDDEPSISVDVELVEQQPIIAKTFKKVPFAGTTLYVAEIDGTYIYQDDIIIPKQFTQPQVWGKEQNINKSVARTSGFWANNTVFFSIDPNLPAKERVTDAIAHWESNTNLKFIERGNQNNYIYFTTGAGCSSYVGMVGGKQNITLANACSTGNTIHEIGHAIGFWHEHSRVDRDEYVKINYENISPGREYNFDTYLKHGYGGQELTSTLDFGSIMMYGSYSFSKNGYPTITKLDGSTFNIQRNNLSSDDIIGINKLYPIDVEPEYTNKKFYTLYGMMVLRYDDRWWYYEHSEAWVEVTLSNGVWYYSHSSPN
jgi:hypothetical protein